MFTIEQVKAAHSKVKSGADFPNYVQDLIQLGVTGYDTYVADGHTDYFGKADYQVSSDAKYTTLTVAAVSDSATFTQDLKAHQAGKTNYPTFCADCAKSGIEKWVVNMATMTCTYFDKAANNVLVETIPQ
jgi:uncharacterized protein YbcV (DUF1398 family)